MKEAKYVRKGRNITTLEDGTMIIYPSIAAAKRKSRELQLDNDGALGRGSVRVTEV